MKALLLCLFLVTAALAGADPTASQNHATNPAFLATGNRSVLELGLGVNAGVQNSFFPFETLTASALEIDLDALAQEIGPFGFRLGSQMGLNSHLTIHAGSLGLGTFMQLESFVHGQVSEDFFQFMAQGLPLGSTSASLEAKGDLFFKTGLYGSWKKDNWVWGGKLSWSLPLAVNKTTGSMKYVSSADGTLTLEGTIDSITYTTVPLETGDQLQGDGKLVSQALGKGGMTADFGLVVLSPTFKRPWFGAAVANLPLTPILAQRAVVATSRFTWSEDDLLAAQKSDTLADPVQTSSLEIKEDADTYLFLPVVFTGFYRLQILGPLYFVPEVRMVAMDPFQLGFGLTGELNLFKMVDLTVGIENRDLMWGTAVTGSVNMRLVELGFMVRAQGPEPLDMFKAKGLSAGVHLAVGF